MPTIINIDINQKAADIHVPILRQPKFMALLTAFSSPTVKLQNDISANVIGGLSYSAWLIGTTYNFGDRVTYGIASHEYINTVASAGNYPTDSNYWAQVSSDTIGLSERLNYNCSTMQLEYILNNRFNIIPGGKIPPYDNTAGNIYIVTNQSYPRVLYSGRGNGTGNSWTALNSASKHWFCPRGNPPSGNFNYTIYVPNALITAVGIVEGPLLIGNIKNETNKYNAVGLTFNTVTY